MCYATGLTPALGSAISPVRTLHSLTSAQVVSVEAALRRMPTSWSLDQQEGYDGDFTLILTTSGQPSELCFALWRTSAGYHLCAMRDDEQISSGVFASLDQAILEIERSTGETQQIA